MLDFSTLFSQLFSSFWWAIPLLIFFVVSRAIIEIFEMKQIAFVAQ